MAIHIGCGSWADPEYVGLLYPKGLPAKERLRVYAEWFDRVELNATYYATPAIPTVVAWAKQTPEKFLFDVKLPRMCSQSPAKSAAGDGIDHLLEAVRPLVEGKKLGAFLLTLAPFFGPARHALAELDELVEKLKPHPVAVELRDRAWVGDETKAETLAYFRSRKLTWVALDLPRLDSPGLLPPIDEVTNPGLAYMRLHGRNPEYLEAKTAAERHHYEYSAADLAEIATRIQTLARQATDVHVSVNTHAGDFAPKAALALRRLLGQRSTRAGA